MKYIGLLTHQQKQAGFFVTQDEDFVYLFRGKNGKTRIKAIFPYETVTVKMIRDTAEGFMGHGVKYLQGEAIDA